MDVIMSLELIWAFSISVIAVLLQLGWSLWADRS